MRRPSLSDAKAQVFCNPNLAPERDDVAVGIKKGPCRLPDGLVLDGQHRQIIRNDTWKDATLPHQLPPRPRNECEDPHGERAALRNTLGSLRRGAPRPIA